MSFNKKLTQAETSKTNIPMSKVNGKKGGPYKTDKIKTINQRKNCIEKWLTVME